MGDNAVRHQNELHKKHRSERSGPPSALQDFCLSDLDIVMELVEVGEGISFLHILI